MAARFGNNDRLCNALGNAVQGLAGCRESLRRGGLPAKSPLKDGRKKNEPISGSALDSFRVLAVRGPRQVAPGAPRVFAIASRSVVTQCLALRRSIRFSV